MPAASIQSTPSSYSRLRWADAQAMLKGDPGCNDENAHADSSKLSEKLNKAMKGDGFIFIDDTGNGKYQKETFVQSFKFASGRCINCTLWFCH